MRFALICFLAVAGVVKGSLILEIDTVAKTLNMSGNATGNLHHDGFGTYTAMWGVGDFLSSLLEGDLNLSTDSIRFARAFGSLSDDDPAKIEIKRLLGSD